MTAARNEWHQFPLSTLHTTDCRLWVNHVFDSLNVIYPIQSPWLNHVWCTPDVTCTQRPICVNHVYRTLKSKRYLHQETAMIESRRNYSTLHLLISACGVYRLRSESILAYGWLGVNRLVLGEIVLSRSMCKSTQFWVDLIRELVLCKITSNSILSIRR